MLYSLISGGWPPDYLVWLTYNGVVDAFVICSINWVYTKTAHVDVQNGPLLDQQESRAVARKPRDAAAVRFGLKFADNIHYKIKSIAKLRKPGLAVGRCSHIENLWAVLVWAALVHGPFWSFRQ